MESEDVAVVRTFELDFCACPRCEKRGNSLTLVVLHDGHTAERVGPIYTHMGVTHLALVAQLLVTRGFVESLSAATLAVNERHVKNMTAGVNSIGHSYPSTSHIY